MAMLIRGQAGNKASGKETAGAKPQEKVKSLLSLYADAPTGEIRLEEFEKFSIDRLMGARLHPTRWPRLRAAHRSQRHGPTRGDACLTSLSVRCCV